MKKIKGIFGAILPFVYALLIMAIASGIIFAGYGAVEGFKLASQGIIDPNEINNAIQELAKGDIVVWASAIGAIVNWLIFSLWYNKKLRLVNRPKLTKVLESKTILLIIVLGISLQIGIAMLLTAIMPLFPNTFDKYAKLMDGLGMGNSVMSFIYLGIIAPFSEEFIFRGVVFNKAKKVMPYMYANILQALLFGIMHGNIVQGTYAFVLGLFLGMVYERRKSIYAAIALHAAVNLSGILLGYIPDAFFEANSYIMIILIVLAIPGLIYAGITLNKNQIEIEEEAMPIIENV